MTLDLPPRAVGTRAAAWDEQQVDLHGASITIDDAPTAGFTAGVRAGARTFTTEWAALLGSLAAAAESRADALRAAVDDVLATDEGVNAAVRAGVHADLLAGSTEAR